MRTIIAIVAILSAMQAHAATPSVDFRWTGDESMGEVSVAVRNKAGSLLVISCGETFLSGSIAIDSSKISRDAQQDHYIQFVIDGKNYPISYKGALFQANSRSTMNEYIKLVKAIMNTSAASMIAEYPDINAEESFSLLNAKDQIIGLDACAPGLKPKTARP